MLPMTPSQPRKHLYASAIFFADQLVTLKGAGPEEIYTLAECYFKNREYSCSAAVCTQIMLPRGQGVRRTWQQMSH